MSFEGVQLDLHGPILCLFVLICHMALKEDENLLKIAQTFLQLSLAILPIIWT